VVKVQTKAVRFSKYFGLTSKPFLKEIKLFIFSAGCDDHNHPIGPIVSCFLIMLPERKIPINKKGWLTH